MPRPKLDFRFARTPKGELLDLEPQDSGDGWWPTAFDPKTGAWASFRGILGEITESRPITDSDEIASIMARLFPSGKAS
jgi:hypothetical protein